MFAAIRILILVYWSPMTLLLYLFWYVNLKRGLEKADYSIVCSSSMGCIYRCVFDTQDDIAFI